MMVIFSKLDDFLYMTRTEITLENDNIIIIIMNRNNINTVEKEININATFLHFLELFYSISIDFISFTVFIYRHTIYRGTDCRFFTL